MASLGDLVVKIGADTRDLNKQLGKVQREVRGMTSNITNLGKSMTRSITLPLAALGAAAVKSAADLETLETSFISLTGGAEQARDMVQQLNKFTAETPFQLEAVAQAARQLLASGTAVGEVNNQLQFLGDIAATSGNRIEDIAAIFSKVQAKGKVELESLNQLAERNIPIFTALAEATGLLPSELGAGAVSVKQFNDTLQGLAQEGGFANGAMERLSKTAAGRFSTALDNLKQAGAELGNVLLPTINKLLEFVTDLAQRFTALNGTTQQMIVELGFVAAAIGPLVVLIPQIIAQITALRGAFALLNTVLIANPIGAVIASIVALTAVVVTFRNRTGDATAENDKFVRSLRDLDKQAQINHVKEQIRELERERAQARAIKRAAEAQAAVGTVGDKFDKQIARGNVTRYAKQIKFLDERIEGLVQTVRDMNAEIGTNTPRVVQEAATATRAYADEMEGLQIKTIKTDKAGKELQRTMWNVGDMVEETSQKFKDFGTAVEEAIERAAEEVLISLGRIIGAMAAGTNKSGDFINSLLSIFAALAMELGALAIGYGVAIEGIKEALRSLNPALAIIAGVALIALGAGLQGAVAKRADKAGVPALAQGGLATGPTMAIVGDNRNARIDPEVISPLSKLKGHYGWQPSRGVRTHKR